jgi:hypothetical protein
VLLFVAKLVPLLNILAQTWDADKYVRGVDLTGAIRQEQHRIQQRQEAHSGMTAFDPKKITETVRSPLFHAYCNMVLLVESVPERLAIDCEACVCHSPLTRNITKYNRALLFAEHYGQGISTCPMAGKMAPELVAGKLLETFEQAWAIKEQDFHVAETWGRGSLSVADREVVIGIGPG